MHDLRCRPEKNGSTMDRVMTSVHFLQSFVLIFPGHSPLDLRAGVSWRHFGDFAVLAQLRVRSNWKGGGPKDISKSGLGRSCDMMYWVMKIENMLCRVKTLEM